MVSSKAKLGQEIKAARRCPHFHASDKVLPTKLVIPSRNNSQKAEESSIHWKKYILRQQSTIGALSWCTRLKCKRSQILIQTYANTCVELYRNPIEKMQGFALTNNV